MLDEEPVPLPTGESQRPSIPSSDYDEQYRPQFHFTTPQGWMNDPTGLLYYQGEYHLFYLWNPDLRGWGQHWMHAVSKDLVHWRHLPIALYSDKKLGMCISGSAVVDGNNTSGFQTGQELVFVAFPTQFDKEIQVVSLAYSNDRGRTWTKYDKNPILNINTRHFRDAKVFWYAPAKKWIMALCRGYHPPGEMYASINLKDWTFLGPTPNGELPDMFELVVETNPDRKRWVFTAGDYNTILPDGSKVTDGSKYFIGSFNGKAFKTESGPHKFGGKGGNFFAGYTFNNILPSDGRRIFMAWKWVRDQERFGPWSGGIQTIPVVLILRDVPGTGLRMFINPVKELQSLRGEHFNFADQEIGEGNSLLSCNGIYGELMEIIAEFQLGSATEFGLHFRKGPASQCAVGYDVAAQAVIINRSDGKRVLTQALTPDGGNLIKWHIFIDRSVVDVFSNGGRTWNCNFFKADPNNLDMELYAKGGTVKLITMNLWKLKAAWDMI